MFELIEQWQVFYKTKFLHLLHFYKKGLALTLILTTIQGLQLLSIITAQSNYTEVDPVVNNFITKLLYYSRLYALFGSTIIIQYIFVLVIITTDVLLFTLLYQQINLIKINKQLKSDMVKAISIQPKSHQIVNSRNTASMIISAYTQLYEELLRIPLQFSQITIWNDFVTSISFNYRDSPTVLSTIFFIISVFGLIITTCISLFYCYHTDEFKFKDINFIGKFNCKNVIYVYPIELSLIALQAFNVSPIAVILIGLFIFILRLYWNLQASFYVSIEMTYFHFKFSMLSVFYILAILIGQTDIAFDLYFLILLFFPLLYHILVNIQQSIFKNITNKGVLLCARYLHYLIDEQIQHQKLFNKPNGDNTIFIYSFIVNHVKDCRENRLRYRQQQLALRQRCACEDYMANQVQLTSVKQMRDTVSGIIQQMLEDSISLQVDRDVQFNLIYFLIQIKKRPSSAMYEVLKLRTNKREHLSKKEQSILFNINTEALIEFEKLIHKNDLKNQKYCFQDLYNLEKSLSAIKKNLVSVVREMKTWYALILSPVINIDILQQKGSSILQMQESLERQLQQTFLSNPLSEECDAIYNLFTRYVSFNKPRPKQFRRESQAYFAFLQSFEQMIFDKDNSIIQITLLQPRGHVVRYTRGFQKAVGWKDEDILNQNIKRFIPRIIAMDHDQYLTTFVDQGRINIVKKEKRIILALNKDEFIFPINTRLRIEASLTEFGASALITPVNQSYGYILLNQNGKIEEISSNIFNDVFNRYLGMSLGVIKSMDGLLFMPELYPIWASLFNDQFDSLDLKFEAKIVLPQLQSQYSMGANHKHRTQEKIRLIVQRDIFTQLSTPDNTLLIFKSNVRLSSLITINLNLVVVEIQDYKLDKHARKLNNQILQSIIDRGEQNSNYNVSQYSKTWKSLSQSQGIDMDYKTDQIEDFDIDQQYQLDSNMINEEIQMIELQKQQFNKIISKQFPSMNSVHQPQSLFDNQPAQLESKERIQSEIQLQQLENQQVKEEYRSEQDENSVKLSDDFNQQQEIQIMEGSSIGSRDSSNQQSTKKILLRSCIYTKDQMQIKQYMFIGAIFLISLSFQILDYILISQYLNNIKQDLIIQQYPYKIIVFFFQYYSHLSPSTIDVKFQTLTHDVIMNQTEYFGQITSKFDIDVNQNISFETQVIATLREIILINDGLKIIDSNQYLTEVNYYQGIYNTIYQNSQSAHLQSIPILVGVEISIIFMCLAVYVYLCLLILQRKLAFYRLFTTMEKESIVALFQIFTNLDSKLNNKVFQKYETNEDILETSLRNTQNKSHQEDILKKHRRVGKQLQSSSNILLILEQTSLRLTNQFLCLVCILCYIFFILDSLFILNTSDSTLTNQRDQQNLFLNTTYQLSIINSLEQVMTYNSSFNIKNQLIKLLTQSYQMLNLFFDPIQSQNIQSEINLLLNTNLCDLFVQSRSSNIQNYDDLFSQQECKKYYELQNGFVITMKYILSFTQDLLQQSNINQTIITLSAHQQKLSEYLIYGSYIITQVINDLIFSFADYQQSLLTILFSISIVISIGSTIILIYGLQQIIREYQQTKILLSLLPFDSLIDNAYIISFIQTETQMK